MHTLSCLCGAVNLMSQLACNRQMLVTAQLAKNGQDIFLSQRLLSQACLICLERIRSRGTNHPKRFGGGFVPSVGALYFLIHCFMIGQPSLWALLTARPGRP